MDIEHNTNQQCQDEDFQIVDSSSQQNHQQSYFDHVVALLQQIVISSDFENKIQLFIKQNRQFIEQQNEQLEKQLFYKFKQSFISYLTQKIANQIPNFNMTTFFELLQTRKHQVDDQLLDTLQSLMDLSCFNEFMRDCKKVHDQVQTYKVLTIKSNKIPQNKKVKGKDNIFGQPSNPLFDMKMKKPSNKSTKTQKISQKTQQQLLVPDLVLTVKGIRKG